MEALAPAQIAFTLTAIRNISGRVMIYDRASHQQMAVSRITVFLRECSRASVTDENGVYLFRVLPAGRYHWRESKRDVVLPDAPACPNDIEINLGAK